MTNVIVVSFTDEAKAIDALQSLTSVDLKTISLMARIIK